MPRAMGINHVALEVGDVEEALAFYGALVDLKLRGRVSRMAFVDMGDQFLALSEGPGGSGGHFGLVVDDAEAVRRALEDTRAEVMPGRGLDFRDPWGNHVQVVDYREVQFLKDPSVLRAMGLAGIEKSQRAREELRSKGIEPGS